MGAAEYFECIGNRFRVEQAEQWKEAGFTGCRLVFKQAMSALTVAGFELFLANNNTLVMTFPLSKHDQIKWFEG